MSTDSQFIAAELLNPAPNARLLWRLRFGGSVLEAHTSQVGHWGVAYRLYLNDRFTFSERYPNERRRSRPPPPN